MAKLEATQAVKQKFGVIGNCPNYNYAIETALKVAPTDVSVLIMGESGAGKEVFPQIIHQFSQRKHGAYIAVNCGSIPEGTIDSELFGHEKGSFTGAVGARKGYFEEANGGTLFLDEVGELPMATQARLLRVLETGEFIKVGSSKVEKTNVRVVAATNVNMIDAISKGRFREDLYYRLNTVPIRVPALRDRKEDIPLLFRKFASDAAEKYKMPAIALTEDGRKAVMAYHWPGNIRQLKNITEQISIIETTRDINERILKEYLPKEGLKLITQSRTKESVALDANVLSSERELILKMLYEMRAELNDLKKIVADLVAGRIKINELIGLLPVQNHKNEDESKFNYLPIEHKSEHDIADDLIHIAKNETDHITNDNIIEHSHIEEEPLSLEEMEKDLIIKALERNQGKRKNAANDLKISERTLYRKIKEYNLDDL